MSVYFKWRDDGHKYNYSPLEATMMVLVTAITNISCLPPLIVLMKRNMVFQSYVGVFTFITSFMYHFTESIGAEIVFMSESEWHILDNMGAIMCFIGLFVYAANFQDPVLEQHLHFSALFIVVVMQMAFPWNLMYTIGPILGYLALVLILSFKRKTKSFSNKEMTMNGAGFIILGAVFFVLSQDEHEDYLRIYHGLWHSVIGYSAIFTWQLHEKPENVIYFTDIVSKKGWTPPIKKDQDEIEEQKQY